MDKRLVRFAILTNSKKGWNDLFNMTIDRARILALRDHVYIMIHDGSKELIVMTPQGELEEIQIPHLRSTLTDQLAEKVIEGNVSQQRNALGVARMILGSSIQIQGFNNRKVMKGV